jgi:hypothetical protein
MPRQFDAGRLGLRPVVEAQPLIEKDQIIVPLGFDVPSASLATVSVTVGTKKVALRNRS